MERAIELWTLAFPRLLSAALEVTIPLSLISFAIAVVVAVAVALLRLYGPAPLRAFAWFYVWLFRGTPLVVQLFIVFFGLPNLGIVLPAFGAAIATLSLNAGAYAAEVVRASILSIPRGQFEAAAALNLSPSTTFAKVIAPQGIRIAIPPLANVFIDLIKGTSLVFAITLVDLFQVGRQIAAATYEPLILYVAVAAFYLFLVSVLSVAQGWLEKRMSRYVAR